MRIAHVNFARGFRGGERQTLNLIQGLAKLGCEQILICRPNSDLMRRALEQSNVSVVAASHPLFGHRGIPKVDLIHVHEARGAYWAWIENAVRGTQYLITRRVVNLIGSGRFTRHVYRRASLLVGVSRFVAQRLAEQIERDVKVVLDSSTRLSVDAGAAQAVRHRLGGGPVIGHIGALHNEVKGQATLIDAFRKLSTAWPNARLVFVGHGRDYARLRLLAGDDPRIVFAGQQEDVAPWLAAMDIFTFPSHMEALGSSVLDAMWLGVPVVASTVGGLPELTGLDERGLSVASHNPGDWAAAIRLLLEDEVLRSRLVDAGRVFAKENDVDANARRYFDLYRGILQSPASSAT